MRSLQCQKNQNFLRMKKLFTSLLIIITYIISNAQDCPPAPITNVKHDGSGNRITWIMPLCGKVVEITQGENCIFGAAGYKQNSFGVYHRFTPEHLATINGGELIEVVFVPMFFTHQIKPGYAFTIQLYKGGKWGAEGERNPGTIIASQELNNNDLIFNEENTITLNTSVIIDASQELWIGYYCTYIDTIQSNHKFPAGFDSGPRKEGLGNIMFLANQWITYYELDDYRDANFCIKGNVQTIDGLSVNIFHNDSPIDTEIPGTSYFHNIPIGDEHCYTVEVNCLEGGRSLLSNEVCIKWNKINEQIPNYSLFPNPANNLLTILRSADNKAQIEICNIIGCIVQSFEINETETKINISKLSTGVYFLKLTDEQGSSIQRFIKE